MKSKKIIIFLSILFLLVFAIFIFAEKIDTFSIGLQRENLTFDTSDGGNFTRTTSEIPKYAYVKNASLVLTGHKYEINYSGGET